MLLLMMYAPLVVVGVVVVAVAVFLHGEPLLAVAVLLPCALQMHLLPASNQTQTQHVNRGTIM